MYRQDIVDEALQGRRALIKQIPHNIEDARDIGNQIIMLEATVQHQLNFLRNELHEVENQVKDSDDSPGYHQLELFEARCRLEFRIIITEKELQ